MDGGSDNVGSSLSQHTSTGDMSLHAAFAPLMLSSHQGITSRRNLLGEVKDLGTQDKDGNTPFHMVAGHLNGYSDENGMAVTALEELLGFSKDAPHHEKTKETRVGALKKTNEAGDSILHIIASKKLKREGDKDTMRKEASKQENAKEIVKYIVFLCPDVLVIKDKKGNTPLHRACYAGNEVMVEALLEADPKCKGAHRIRDPQNIEDDTPLHSADRESYPDRAKKLMVADQSHGAILTRNDKGEAPIHIVADEGQRGTLEELLKRMTCKEVVSAAWDPEDNVKKTNGWTALHFAANKGHERIVELLLLNGADSQQADKHNLLASDIARRATHINVADFIRQYRPRCFRLNLESNEYKAGIDDHFLALNWPNWDKAVRQQLGEPRARMWPQATFVNQLIFKANDVVYEAVPIDNDSRGRSELLFDRNEQKGDKFPVIHLAPIHQAQIRQGPCARKGWIMKEKNNFQKLFRLHEEEDQARQIMKPVSPVSLFDSSVFEGRKRSTRWIHFPANNRAWIEDLCRCMYSHGSLKSELTGILRFIEDNFEVEGFNMHHYRKHGFITQLLEMITDPPPNGHDTRQNPKAAAWREPATRRSRRVKLPRDKDSAGDEESLGDEESAGGDEEGLWNEEQRRCRYSAYSLVFPLLDMDFVHPGFSDSEVSKDSNRNTVIQTHWEDMEALRMRREVFPARSLDHYYHRRVSSQDRQERVEDQVLIKFMTRQLSSWDKSQIHVKVDYPITFFAVCSRVLRKLRWYTSRSYDPDRFEAFIEEGEPREAVGDTNMVEKATPSTQNIQPPLQILVVPQIWLWKFDNLVITSFPERWDCTSQRGTLLDAIRERVEDLNIGCEVQPNRLVTEILIACDKFQPTVNVGQQSFTWAEVFDDEILSISRNIKDCYHRFCGGHWGVSQWEVT